MKSARSLISGFLFVFLVCSFNPVFAAAALDQCTASDLGPHNPPIKDQAKYCACVLADIASAPELSSQVKSFYQNSFSRNAIFVDGEYRSLSEQETQAWRASEGYKKLTPEQAQQLGKIEFINLKCYTNSQ